MKAAILAAGVGSRLRPITTTVPKCMVKIGGRPLLGYQLDAFRKAGVADIKIAVGYEASTVIDYCKDIKDLSIEFFVSEDYENTNNMYSMYMMRHALKGDDFIFCNGDVVYDDAVISAMVNSDSEDYIAVDEAHYDPEAMKVIVSADGCITGIRKTFPEDEAYGSSIDLYKLTSKASNTFFDEIETIIEKQGSVKEWTEVALDRLCSEKRIRFKPFDIHGRNWVEIDNYLDLAKADRVFSVFGWDGRKAVFLDIDGTLAIGDRAIDGSPEFVRGLRDRGLAVHFVTNNSSRSKADYVQKLQRLGIDAGEQEIVLSTDGLVALLRSKQINRVFCLGTESMRDELRRAGIEHVEDEPEAIVLGYDTELTYPKLRKACAWINKGKDYYATHMDVVCPSADGPIPDAGTLIRTIEMTTGRSPKAILGKPNASMLSHIVGPCYQPSEAVFVGDRMYTDKVMAQRLGMDFVCVLSGETRREDLQSLSEEEWPALVADSVADLL